MTRKFLVKRQIYILKKYIRKVQINTYYGYENKKKFMDKKLIENFLIYEYISLSTFIRRTNEQIYSFYDVHKIRSFYSFGNCLSIYSNKDRLPSLSRNITKKYCNVKLSYFKRSILNELDYSSKRCFINE